MSLPTFGPCRTVYEVWPALLRVRIKGPIRAGASLALPTPPLITHRTLTAALLQKSLHAWRTMLRALRLAGSLVILSASRVSSTQLLQGDMGRAPGWPHPPTPATPPRRRSARLRAHSASDRRDNHLALFLLTSTSALQNPNLGRFRWSQLLKVQFSEHYPSPRS